MSTSPIHPLNHQPQPLQAFHKKRAVAPPKNHFEDCLSDLKTLTSPHNQIKLQNNFQEKDFSDILQHHYRQSRLSTKRKSTQLATTLHQLCNPKKQNPLPTTPDQGISHYQRNNTHRQSSTVSLIEYNTLFIKTVVAHNVSETLGLLSDNRAPETFIGDIVEEKHNDPRYCLNLGMAQFEKITLGDQHEHPITLANYLNSYSSPDYDASDTEEHMIDWLKDAMHTLFDAEVCDYIHTTLSLTAFPKPSAPTMHELDGIPAPPEHVSDIKELITLFNGTAPKTKARYQLPNGIELIIREDGKIVIKISSKGDSGTIDIGTYNPDTENPYDTETERLYFTNVEGQSSFIQLMLSGDEHDPIIGAKVYSPAPSNHPSDIETQHQTIQQLLSIKQPAIGERKPFKLKWQPNKELIVDQRQITYKKGDDSFPIQCLVQTHKDKGDADIQTADMSLSFWYYNHDEKRTETLNVDFSDSASGKLTIETQFINDALSTKRVDPDDTQVIKL